MVCQVHSPTDPTRSIAPSPPLLFSPGSTFLTIQSRSGIWSMSSTLTNRTSLRFASQRQAPASSNGLATQLEACDSVDHPVLAARPILRSCEWFQLLP